MIARVLPLLMVCAAACGGRDPLFGAVDDDGGTEFSPTIPGTGPGPVAPGTTPDASTPGPGGSGMPAPPPATRDGGTTRPPVPTDAGPSMRPDGGVRPPPPNQPCQLPACLEKLEISCMASANCVQQLTMSASGVGTNICYDNGVKAIISFMGGRSLSISSRWFRADGSVCFSTEPVQGSTSGVTAFSYRGADGNIVATATLDGNFLAVTCTGQSTPQVISATCQPSLSRNGPLLCASGRCN